MDKTSIWLNTQHGQKLYPFAFTFEQLSEMMMIADLKRTVKSALNSANQK